LLAALVFKGLMPVLLCFQFCANHYLPRSSFGHQFSALYQYSIFISVDNKYYSSSFQGWISDKSGSLPCLFLHQGL
ncbi:MAG: hypothetical protein Q4Q20_04540, partial [Methanocorpusculum sp.]|nr:hypothetical protein [Methanocorpusculum sp.]